LRGSSVSADQGRRRRKNKETEFTKGRDQAYPRGAIGKYLQPIYKLSTTKD